MAEGQRARFRLAYHAVPAHAVQTASGGGHGAGTPG
jgi:hypothetical protein